MVGVIRNRWREVDRSLVGVILLGSCLRGALFVNGLVEPARFRTSDSNDYLALARHLSRAYVRADRRSELFDLGLERPPGYPLFVWLTGGTHHPGFTVIAHLLLGVAAMVLTYRLARQLFDRRVGVVAALVIAVDPTSLAHSNYVLAETVFTVVVLGAMVLILRPGQTIGRGRAVCAGALLALGVLLRPIAVLFPVVLVPALWLLWHGRRRDLTAAVALVLAFALPVGGWIVRNQVVADLPSVSSVLGKELLYSGAGGAIQEEEGHFSVQGDRDLTRRSDGAPESGGDAAGRRGSDIGAALGTMARHPVGVAKSLVRGGARTLLGPGKLVMLHTLFGRPPPGKPWDATQLAGVSAPVSRALLAYEMAVLVVLYVLAAAGVVRQIRERRYALLACLLVPILYFGFSAPGLAGHARYRVPLVPYLAVLAGVGYTLLSDRRAAANAQAEALTHG